MNLILSNDENQYFKFKRQSNAILFVDGNYMISISKSLSLKIDIERLFDHLTKQFFRKRTYWYSAIESSLDRSNNIFRFLDRLRYIPRTKVYAGRLSSRQVGHYDSALRTDAGSALIVTMVEQAMLKNAEYFILVAKGPEYIPAIRAVQRHGGIVLLISLNAPGDLRSHPELSKITDEHLILDEDTLQEFEYRSENEYYDDVNDDTDDNDDDDLNPTTKVNEIDDEIED